MTDRVMPDFEEFYGPVDRERSVTEPPKPVTRGDFARDRARVLHSSALRRLGGKTQVVGPGTDDFARTRLTHSLEVAQVGREIATGLGCHPDIVDAACLAHDVGHPPFGHHGEQVLDEAAAAIGGFEGNAQTLRLLTRLEPKVMRGTGAAATPAGLNLTRAALDATTKYPWGQGEAPNGSKKFGVYGQDREVFEWLRAPAPQGQQCIEAMVMDLSDDIAYSVHDVEDAIVGGWLDPTRLNVESVRHTVIEIAHRFAPGVGEQGLQDALLRLQQHPLWLHEFSATRTQRARLKDLTSQLIGRFAKSAHRRTREVYGPGPLVRYQAKVLVPDSTIAEMSVLKAIAVHFVMNHDARKTEYESQHLILVDLVDVLQETAPHHLEQVFVQDWREAHDDGARLRVIIDQISVLTDASAMALHTELLGRSDYA